MKTYHSIFLLAILSFLCSCYQEDAIDAEPTLYKRTYDTTSNNLVEKFQGKYFYAYDKYYLTDADTSDYLYNFGAKNKVLLVAPENDPVYLMQMIELVDRIFLKYYPDEFIRTCFPHSFILSERVVIQVNSVKYEDLSNFSSFSFFSIGLNQIKDLDEEKLKEMSADLHAAFLVDFVNNHVKNLVLPSSFQETSKSLYNRADYSKKLTKEELYALGFTKERNLSPKNTAYPRDLPEDLRFWVSFLISTPQEEIERIITEHKLMKIKYNALLPALNRLLGFDYKELSFR